jgi:hypothetical protein
MLIGIFFVAGPDPGSGNKCGFWINIPGLLYFFLRVAPDLESEFGSETLPMVPYNTVLRIRVILVRIRTSD